MLQALAPRPVLPVRTRDHAKRQTYNEWNGQAVIDCCSTLRKEECCGACSSLIFPTKITTPHTYIVPGRHVA
jgi:hypothetical protein